MVSSAPGFPADAGTPGHQRAPRSPHAAIAALGLELPPVSAPKGVYVPAVRAGELVQVSGQIPLLDGRLSAVGQVGHDLGLEEARALSARCALASLAAVDTLVGLDRVARVVKVVGYVASAPGFTRQWEVVAGADELLLAVFGEAAGVHTTTAVGVTTGPLNAPVEIEILVQITR